MFETVCDYEVSGFRVGFGILWNYEIGSVELEEYHVVPMELWFCEVGEITGNWMYLYQFLFIMILFVHSTVTVKVDHYVSDINEWLRNCVSS